MPRWGITLPLTGIPLSAHRELVKELSALGYTDVWIAETNGTDAFTPLTLTAEWAPELRLDTAIVVEVWNGGDRKAANAAISNEVVDEMVVHGGPEACRKQVAEYVQNGLETPVLSILPTAVDRRELVRALAP